MLFQVVVEVPLDFNMTDKSRMAMLVPNPDGSMKLVPFEVRLFSTLLLMAL